MSELPKKKRTLPKGMTPWKPGQSGNPSGRPKDPEYLREIRKLPVNVAQLLWSKWLSKDADELRKESENWHLSALELAMCRAILRDIETGDLRNIEIGLNRVVGRVSDFGYTKDGDADLKELPTEELMARVRSAIQVLECARNEKGEYEVNEK